ncbi:MAG: TonB-dependent receptor [Candidatus Vogelbacteria bacterium CG10_big_fil_rev_8_21_14_0_10_45_14]|uniref:TonB-dependent receptor n=1 Tax=Candidatus Vogelbacteria bacterium CG10_big_fil_rev_8_21_14_0_10_45_14 TaxID=1975042 RepID=A0A2H0RKD7_9BACT|nr:MAG: TonB-dependent receptor [Candidatus Vogelbacteria bacterium CG10_big_fil_rev_8_21_14_0_10_45_14]
MAKKLAMVLGITFILIGLLGFVGNPLVGGDGALFETNSLHNWVHILTGVIAVWVSAKSMAGTLMFLKIFGIVYLLVAVLGFFMDGKVLGLFHSNPADNWLHLVVALLFIWAGFWSGKDSSAHPAS